MPLIPNFAGFLNTVMGYSAMTGPTYSSGVRNAMVFTSRLRQEVSKVNQSNQALASGAIIQAALNAGAQDSFLGFFFQGAGSFMPEIAMLVNPNTAKFSQPKRWTKKNTKRGSVFFHFTNDQGQNNDILTISFRGNTGNIDPRGSLTTGGDVAQLGTPTGTGVPNPDDTGALLKLITWHNLYLLSREPQKLPDATENEIIITYISPLLPQNIDFHGFFNQVIDFEESARKPNSRDYNFDFTVSFTEPSLDEILDSITSVLQQAALTATSNGTIFGNNITGASP